MKKYNIPFASVANLVNGWALDANFASRYQGKPIETILQLLVGEVTHTLPEPVENDSEAEWVGGGVAERVLAARVVVDYAPEQFPDGYVFVDVEEV